MNRDREVPSGQRENGDIDVRPLTIALVVDTIGNHGNGTSNSALQYAQELERQGHHVRLVGIGSQEYPAKVNRIPLVSHIAARQQMQFAKPSDTLFRTAFAGVDVVHIYMPFSFGRRARIIAQEMGIPVTAGFHVQPENVLYSAGPLRFVPGASRFIYWLFKRWLYRYVDHIHTPTQMIAEELRKHHYDAKLHAISNGYSPRFVPRQPRAAADIRPPYRVAASGRLSLEKSQITLIKAISLCRHGSDIELSICGTGPMRRYLQMRAKRLLNSPVRIGFQPNDRMPGLLRSQDLLVHASVVDIESLSVMEGIGSGVVPIIARSGLSAASQFALTDQSLFEARNAQQLADRIDWWLDHPMELVSWERKYARFAAQRYSVEFSVRQFIEMERESIAEYESSH